MKNDVLDKIKELKLKAEQKGNDDNKVIFVSTGTALNQVVRNKEQAELFMKRLKALD